ncbi:MAG: hypothetical protein V3T23_08200 [Nitrososphaerales archaeon]
MTRTEYINAVLEVTGGQSWELVREGLADDIKNIEVQELQSEEWGEVKELRGFRRALIYIRDMRNLAKLEAKHDAV